MKKISKIIIGLGGTAIAAILGYGAYMYVNSASTLYGVVVPNDFKLSVEAINSMFEVYCGKQMKKDMVLGFYRRVEAFNLSADQAITYIGPSEEEINQSSFTKRYNASVTRYYEDGQIAEITVTVE